ncbi:MAG: 50S ribosomal protein L2 [Candidatus Harrisonbacteria bacterium CG10_big_fil_rev_8_21_14_0_10_38_8]|uniref:Large ribosomal subunit protein uL2 n=1 Tax=Candidatus Harrisonbacteria bacterium CG10_big_fil_rev_8_21_14_0_10_38_8 TaxID=1974582 RepID=A0A2M6WK67_9BACT|nr:MAG: 50S ribosomal protein L2 [Candidatus Harrisonbacteria bacterium CG10_big_fil_rev_8_21_14_0_10_38_8]
MKTYKPTTSSIRQKTVVNYREFLTTDKPKKSLVKKLKRNKGRNNRGVITMRHKGGGHKRRYRDIDFKMEKRGIPAKVKTVEYDPNRSTFISLVCYNDGEQRYILAPKDLKVGDTFIADEKAPVKVGNRMPLGNMPIGTFVHNVELRPNGGGKLARSAGTYLEVLGTSAGLTDLKMPSKEIRRISEKCFGSIGQLSNTEHNLVNYGKAGTSRWKGIRPTVRGSAMNPVDHKYGGGEGKQPRGTKRPKDIWGNITGGKKTRDKKKYSGKFIVKRRSKRK